MICEDRYKLTQLVAMSSSCRNVMAVGDGITVEGQKVCEKKDGLEELPEELPREGSSWREAPAI